VWKGQVCPYGSTFEIFEQKTRQILFLGAFPRKRIQFLNALGRFRSELTEIPYVSKTIIKYIPFGHDASNWEQEADNGYRVLDNFWKYVQRFSRKGNPLESLFNNDKMSEENKMRIINKWWKSWQNYMQKEADNLIKNSTLIDMKKRTKQNLTEKKKMQLS